MQTKRVLTATTIALINIAATCNIKNFPLMAEYGFSALLFLILSSIFFFIPVSLVAAELATAWPERGVYTWVKLGISPRMGFLAIWLQWIENVIWYPTILSFIASTFAFIFNPDLAQNKHYVLFVILITFWLTTFINFTGMRVSGWISSISALFGTILPIALIILLGLGWILGGQPMQIQLNWGSFFPDLTSFKQLVLLSGFLLGFAGMEMSAVHARDVQNPKRDYPRAIVFSATLIIILSGLGSIAIAAIVPVSDLELTSGGMEAFRYLFTALNIPWAVPVIAAVMTVGAFGMMSTWIVGPSRGLLATAQDGDLPPFFQITNGKGMPVGIFITQAIIVSLLSLVFLYMPSVSTSYWILIALTSELYMVMYVLMFIAALRLRHLSPETQRPYQVPGGKLGLWIVSLLGMTGACFALVIGLFPPSQLDTGNTILYESILIGGTLFFCLIPLLIYHVKKPSWKKSS